jgi:flavorubredoxin
MHDFLHHLKLKLYQKRRVAIVENGSWAPCAARVMHDMLSQMKDLDFVAEHVTIRGAMKAHDVLALEALADEILA